MRSAGTVPTIRDGGARTDRPPPFNRIDSMALEIDGLWTAEVGSFGGWTRGGIVIFANGRLLGGGDHYYCIGHYELRGHILVGEARSLHFHGTAQNAFGDTAPDFRFSIKGRRSTDFIDGEVHRIDQPAPSLPFRLIWRAPLR